MSVIKKGEREEEPEQAKSDATLNQHSREVASQREQRSCQVVSNTQAK
jgi:hypothetical protein